MSSSSLAGRAALAVGLMIGFYLFAATIAGVLLFIPYAAWASNGRINVQLAVFCVFGGLAILWSILPRVDRFEPGGPRLHAHEHPRLFDEIQHVARSVGQPLPEEVYLVADVNAFVAQRGGLMGFGSRPVMGIGLPLLQVLTKTQLRAVLAHEFGHYHGGDTKLGPWVYKTHGAIWRTLQNLGDSVLRLPFQWYGAAFLRISHAVSRRQELSADALAAGLTGAAPLIAGLQATSRAALAYDAYWGMELAPVLQAGFRPPIAEGFSRFLKAPRTVQILDQSDEESKNQRPDPYDTHPPLSERIAALAAMPAGAAASDDPPALSLLDEPEALETRLLATVAGGDPARLAAVTWAEVAVRVHLPSWVRHCREHGEPLRGVTGDSLPAFAADADRWVARLGAQHRISLDDARGLLQHTVGAAVALRLVAAGWDVETGPGEPVRLVKGGVVLEPFDFLEQLSSGRMPAAEWRRIWADAGLDATAPLLHG